MGKKYIIEIEKEFHDAHGNKLYKAKNFNTLVFDDYGLGMMEEYKEPEKPKFTKSYIDGFGDGYSRGYEEGCKAVAYRIDVTTNGIDFIPYTGKEIT